MSLRGYFFLKLQTAESALKCLKRPVSEQLWTVNVLKGPKSFLNMHASIFDIFFDDFERKSVRKILS